MKRPKDKYPLKERSLSLRSSAAIQSSKERFLQNRREERRRRQEEEPFAEEEAVLLEVQEVEKEIGKKTVLQDLNFSLVHGHLLALLGPNGAGKSTLLKLLSGLKPKSRGRLLWEGSPWKRCLPGQVSYLPDADFLERGGTRKEACRYFQLFYPDFSPDLFHRLADRLEIPENVSQKHLSQGMQDRLHFALAMSRTTQLYLLDEPLSGVDPLMRELLVDVMLQRMEQGASIILATQQVQEFEVLFDEVLFLKEGTPLRYGPAEGLREEEGLSINRLYKKLYQRGEAFFLEERSANRPEKGGQRS